jgi:hypothetical protein
MKMVRRGPRSMSGKRREWALVGAEGQHQRVPAMGRGTCLVTCRIRGEGTGAGDGQVWPETVSSGGVNRGGVAQGMARRMWVWRARAADRE